MPETIHYQHARFSTALPANYLYTDGHFWLHEIEKNVWRIGLTQYATRMLGEMVEFRIDLHPGDPVQLGQEIGSIEGFKAIAGLYSVMTGIFVEANPAAQKSAEIIDQNPYDDGWLYTLRGTPEKSEGTMDVHAYITLLEKTFAQRACLLR